jgi:hypothetical protein
LVFADQFGIGNSKSLNTSQVANRFYLIGKGISAGKNAMFGQLKHANVPLH